MTAPPHDGPLPDNPVWTGRELLFVGAVDDAGSVVALGLDPELATWPMLPLPPVPLGSRSAAVWTGKELVVCCGWAPHEAAGAAAYDLETNAWRRLPDPPLAGSASAVWAGGAVTMITAAGMATFDPVIDQWRSLPPPAQQSPYAEMAWTGTDVIVWPAPSSRATYKGEAFNPLTERWHNSPNPCRSPTLANAT